MHVLFSMSDALPSIYFHRFRVYFDLGVRSDRHQALVHILRPCGSFPSVVHRIVDPGDDGSNRKPMLDCWIWATACIFIPGRPHEDILATADGGRHTR